MNTLLLVLLLANLLLLIYMVFGRKREDTGGMMLLQQQLSDLTRTLDARMDTTTDKMQRSVHMQLRDSQELMQRINTEMSERLMHVVRSVGEVSESSKQVFAIADKLHSLEKTLKNQKQRGNLGEASLRLTLENILPPDAFVLQYGFADGAIVDAVVRTKDGLIPIDAKFSLDNYERLVRAESDPERVQYEKAFVEDLRRRIDETAKYIRAKEGTLPFAFMFIPAEAIYYDLISNEVGAAGPNARSLIEYAYRDKHVIVVSPTTFAAYLQSVLYGFRAFKIEESAKQIAKHVEALDRHLSAYDLFVRKLGSSLSTTVNHYNTAQKEFAKIDKDIAKITGSTSEGEHELLDKPEVFE